MDTLTVFSLIFSNPTVPIFLILAVLRAVMIWILEDIEFKKTYKNSPYFLRPSKNWWKENKGYVRGIYSHKDTK
ncbi:hypothetical protein [Paenibacillus macquariensis]|uniref:Uncharacterized protein n=1 Tax=Paenibacillus macquariensis TaxID=948756 RepID=A0ABY1KEY4_9BACL|nr:hypothetical protein [Paenibacillus macquariensis]OAB29600.1 hypothetical protein PMSM_23740 [Paenibacillus macquariensis subsp. macquariensis]SIR73592.1 hypothetical protein SAMN05421578_1533 [Paenibacillus macquariensis]